MHIPVPEVPQKAITTKKIRPQFRKPGVIDTPPDAISLLGKYVIDPEVPEFFLERSIEEVRMVRDEEKRVRESGESIELRHYLNRLEVHLIVDRFIGARINGTIPEGYDVGVGFLSAEKLPETVGAHLVEVMVDTPRYHYTFTILPPRAYKKHRPELQYKLNTAIDAIGGYDYYDYRKR